MFKRYVKSRVIPEHMLSGQITNINWKQDNYLKNNVKLSRSLSPYCADNIYARTEKSKIASRVLSYLCKNNYSCDDVFYELYSKINVKSRQKANEFIRKYKKEVLLRQQYIWTLNEIYDQRQSLSKLFNHLEDIAEYPEYSESKSNSQYVKNAVEFLNETEKYKDHQPNGKFTIADLAIDIRNNYLNELDKSLNSEAVLAYWLTQRYELLSNTDLKKVGDLLCEVYKIEYKTDIQRYRSKKRKDYDRNRYIPQKSSSAAEKKEKVRKLKTKGYTQKKTAELLRISRSTVERYWKG
ncbi:hypothetical protein [Tangfeifania diversioriginum]|nr:hypothetical protein [Tangfeifania diversioriginum]